MLERDQEWSKFCSVLAKNGSRADSDISQYFSLHIETTRAYRHMMDGKVFLSVYGKLPTTLKDHAVGFRYRRVGRWVPTTDIEQARKDYDAGTHEMATGLEIVNGEQAWVLYSIPRKTVDKSRRLYFSALGRE